MTKVLEDFTLINHNLAVAVTIEWPWSQLFGNAHAKSFIFIYNLPTFNIFQNLTFVLDFRPLATSGDLETIFWGNQTSKESFSYITWQVYNKFENWPKMTANSNPNVWDPNKKLSSKWFRRLTDLFKRL